MPLLSGRGHDVVAASRATGVDLLTGDGLADAPTGADVVVDVINAPTPEDSAQVREVGGPQKRSFGEMARAVLRRQGRELPVVDDPAATYHGIPVDQTTLVTGAGADLCATRLADWLARH
ncbi:hypothetical protein [Mycolicibacterium sp. A43C]